MNNIIVSCQYLRHKWLENDNNNDNVLPQSYALLLKTIEVNMPRVSEKTLFCVPQRSDLK